MKKLLALLLSMVMAVSLAVPALADGPDGPPADDYFDDWDDDSGWWDEDYDWWAEERAYLDSHPGLEEQLRAGAYDHFEEYFGSYWASPEEYMEMLGLTEEEFLEEMVLEQVSILIWAEQLQQAIDEQKQAMGGVPGQIGVMVNGQYIQFPDAAPEITGGRTMVPVRALVETLGGEVDYGDNTVQFVVGGREYEFVVGNAAVAVSAAGVPVDTIQMDCAPYIKDSRTYVPIRFISEALGYEVDWDGVYQTAILLDREALAADIDARFSILNRVLAASNPALNEGESWRIDMEGNLSLTLFDTLNGNHAYTADLAGSVLYNNEALNGSCSVTFDQNTVDALMALLLGVGGFGDETDENAQLIRSVLTGLKDMEAVMNREGMAWFHAPILDELGGQENAWFAMDLGAELSGLMFSDTDTVTMGYVLSAVPGGDSVEELAALREIVGLLGWLYGDDQFTTADGVSTRTIGADELTALYEELGIDPDEAEGIWKEYSITMEVDSEGAAAVAVVMETAAQWGVPAIRIVMDGAQNAQGSTATVEIHVANLGKLELSLTASQQTTGEVPNTEPPENANIVETTVSATNEPATSEP